MVFHSKCNYKCGCSIYFKYSIIGFLLKYLLFISYLFIYSLCLGQDIKYDYTVFSDESKTEYERIEAIYYVQLSQYKFHQQEIDSFVNELSDPKKFPELSCKLHMLKNRILFMERKFVDYIPAAMNVLNGNCPLTFRDTVLIYWSLAKSIEHGGIYLEALKYRKKLEVILPRYFEMYPGHLHYLTNMSDFYYAQGKFKEAKNSYLEKLNYLYQHKSTFYLGSLTNSVGVCYNHLGMPDSAMIYFTKALGLYRKYTGFDSAYIEGLIKGNIAQSLMLKKEYHKAIPLLELDISGSRTEEPKNAIASMIEIAECYSKIGNVSTAKLYYDSIDNWGQEFALNYRLRLKYLDGKARVFEGVGETDSVIKLLHTIISIIETREREIEINQSNVLMALYGVKEKQEIFDKQKIENQNAQLELIQKSKNQWLIIGISGGIFVVLIVVLIAHNKVSKQKRQLQKNNELNKASLDEKEVLLKEIHHRVKNNLQVVSGLMHLQSSKIDSPEVLAMIEEGQHRIESMALIHHMLYQDDQDVAVIECQEYLDQLVGQIEYSYGINKNVEISIDAGDMKLDFDYAIPLGLIVNELTVNSFKYAFPNGTGKIDIQVKYCDKKYFNMIFSDNGIGINDIESSNSLGLRLVRMFCEEMDAELLVTNTPGATFRIYFKECNKNERKG